MSSDAYWTEEKVPQKQTKKTQQTQKNPSPVDAEDAPVPEHLAWAMSIIALFHPASSLQKCRHENPRRDTLSVTMTVC